MYSQFNQSDYQCLGFNSEVFTIQSRETLQSSNIMIQAINIYISIREQDQNKLLKSSRESNMIRKA